ncbi:hypothetical protein WICPIJ_009584 [Wickerhamomyces pijperi]|uniref:Palmitoyltransferase n=1 Tax=Wickerhamomyces pijperi TaxID=599730 RepID=A0A9P8PMM4_WICPI|nr:hypothetical protein WICPIJ_009584 [Wickerhamomyces pijperi]
MVISHLNLDRILRKTVPVIVFLLLVYGSFLYSYYICWNEIYHHHSKSTGIGLIIGNILFILLIYFIWLQMFLVGPGFQPHVPIYKFYEDYRDDYESIPPPDYFICTQDGYPIYCTMCQSIKIDRSRHSGDFGKCIGRFDHFCYWIGTVIGKQNYRLFMQFLIWFQLYFVYSIVTTSVFIKDIYRRRNNSLHPQIIVLYILLAFWLVIVFALFVSHVYYLWINITSIEEIKIKQHRRDKTPDPQAFINFKHKGERYVLRYSSLKDHIWNRGLHENWIQVMGKSVFFWFVPWRGPINDPHSGDLKEQDYYVIVGDYFEEISDKFKQHFIERIERKDYESKFTMGCSDVGSSDV